MWKAFDEKMIVIGHTHRVTRCEDVFLIDDNRIISMLKVRVIQAMLQIEWTEWGIDRVRKLAMELKCIETYNAAAQHKILLEMF